MSFFTKDPGDYLAGTRPLHIGGKTSFDARARDASGNVVIAGGRPRLQASLFASYGRGHEPRNKGRVETETVTRTALNPQDRRTVQALGKLVAGRRKDWVDIENVLAFQGVPDREYPRSWAERLGVAKRLDRVLGEAGLG